MTNGENISFEKIYEFIKNGDVTGFNNYKNSFIPKTLYKYYPLFDEKDEEGKKDEKNIAENNKRLDTISENKLWLSGFDKMNDVFEASYFYTDVQRLKANGYDDKHIELFRFYKKLITGACRITSFSTKLSDCIPMWAHYANNHKGFCVEYEVTDTKSIFPVFYENKRVKSTIIPRIVNELLELYKNSNNEYEKDLNGDIIALGLMLCIKHKSWDYENEYRILFPYIEDLSYSCDELGVKPVKIYTGFKTSQSHKDVLQELSDKLNLGKIALGKLSDTKYELEFK